MDYRTRQLISRAAVGICGAFLLLHTGFAAELGIGAGMPSFALKGTDGKLVSSDSLGGKRALVVVFMDHHCNYCQAYQSRLADLQKSYGDKGVQFVLINPNATADNLKEMKEQASKMNYPSPYLMDDTQTAAKAFGATRTPEVFVFGADRKLVYRGQIDDNTEAKLVRKANLKLAIDAVLNATPHTIEKPVTSVFGCSIKWLK